MKPTSSTGRSRPRRSTATTTISTSSGPARTSPPTRKTSSSVDGDLPGTDDEVLRVGGDVLAGPELVEIVVVAVDLLGRDRPVELVGFILLRRVEVGGRVGPLSAGRRDTGAQRECRGYAEPKTLQDGPTVGVDRLWRGQPLGNFP